MPYDESVTAEAVDAYLTEHPEISVVSVVHSETPSGTLNPVWDIGPVARRHGAVTRFGPFFDAAAMGGAFCLCAMAVPAERFDSVAAQVNAHPEVAHNYERAHDLNMWFVLATEKPAQIEETARAIEAETGLEVFRFPKEEEFFIGFRVTT